MIEEREIDEKVIDGLTERILKLSEGDVLNTELAYACFHAAIRIGDPSKIWFQFTEDGLAEAWMKEDHEREAA